MCEPTPLYDSRMTDAIIVRLASEHDFFALSRMDLTYDASRVLLLSRDERADGYAFGLQWFEREPTTEVYATYDEPRLRRAIGRADLFLTALRSGDPVGLLMIVLPSWTDAGEITDLAVDRSVRRAGAGRALIDVALQVARSRGLRSLWVEPRCDNAPAINFYRALGFRLSGFNDRMYSNDDHAPGRTTLFMYREV